MTKKAIGHALAIITIIIWGTTFIASKLLLVELTPIQVMLMRFIIAYIVLLILNREFHKFIWKDELLFLLLALFGGTLYFICENTALIYSTASNVSIIVTLAPIFTAFLAHFFTKDEQLHRGTFAGFIIAFFGVVLVVFNGTVYLKLNPLGDLLSMLAAFLWAVYSIILKREITRFGSVFLARKIALYSALTTVPMLLIEGKEFPVSTLLEPKLMISLLLLGIFGSGLCYVSWNVATKRIGIVTTNNYIYLIPFVTLIAAGFILNEKVTLMGTIGAVLIVAGIIVARRRSSITKTQETEKIV